MGKDKSNIVYKEDVFPPGYYFLVRTFPLLDHSVAVTVESVEIADSVATKIRTGNGSMEFPHIAY